MNKDKTITSPEIEDEIFSILRKIIKTVDIFSAKLRETSGISASQLSCLMALQNSGPVALSTLGRMVALSPSMITSIVDQLEKKEYVFRERSAPDRRIILINLTAKGREIIQKAPPSFQQLLVEGLAGKSQTEKLDIKLNLEKLLTIASSILIDSYILGVEDKLVGVEPDMLKPGSDR